MKTKYTGTPVKMIAIPIPRKIIFMNDRMKSFRVHEVPIPVSIGLATMGTMVMNMVAKM